MNRKIMLGMLVVALSGWTIAQAEEGKPGAGKPGPGKERGAEFRQKMLEKFDKNGDGKLDEDEKKAAREAFQKRKEGQNGPRGEEFKKKMLEKFDKNGDGKLDPEEMKAAREAFQKMRAEKGGEKGKERRPGGKPKPPAKN